MSETLDLDKKINIIYNFIYNKSDEKLYKLEKINPNDINIDRVKISENNGVIDIDDIKGQMLKGKFQIQEYLEDIGLLILKRYSDNLSYLIMIRPYFIDEKINKLKTPNNRDNYFSYLFSELVLTEKTSSILLPIFNIDLDFQSLVPILQNLPVYENILNLLNTGQINTTFKVGLRESFMETKILKNLLEESVVDWKYLILQVFLVLIVIQNEYPTFRHNKLDLCNILVYEYDFPKSIKKLYYKNNNFELKNINYEIKLTNFYHSTIELLGDKTKSNEYSDILHFLDNLLEGYKNKFDKETKDFIDEFYPKKYRKKGSWKPNGKLEDWLNHSYFKFSDENEKKSFTTNSNNNLYEVSKYKLNSRRKLKKDKKQDNILKRRLYKNIKQTGGYKPTQNGFAKQKNNPFLSNDARQTFSKRKGEEQQPKEPPILAEQKVYDLEKPKQPKMPINWAPNSIPLNYGNPNPNGYGYVPKNIPVTKQYNITLSNGLGDHGAVSRIYEDMLPIDPHNYTHSSVYEREQLINYFRNSVLEYGDGEEMAITGGVKKSILSYLKLMEMNPYSINPHPYKELPKGFLLYTGAYPIRYDKQNNLIHAAKQPIGVNIRIYQITMGALKAFNLDKKIEMDDFDVWREIKFYEKVRNDIIRRKVSPNFINLYLYITDTTSLINWNKLDEIKYSDKPKNDLKNQIDNRKQINKNHELKDLIDTMKPLINRKNGNIFKKDGTIKQDLIFNKDGTYKKGVVLNPDGTVDLTKSKLEVRDITQDSSKLLVAVTEAPNQNMIKWASPLYESVGSIFKQVETGHHNENIWKVIIFQMVYSLAVLQEAELYLKELSLEKSIFIKDIQTDIGPKNHWIYNVGEFEFFIPNYGYILMIDSSYSNVNLSDDEKETKYKINGKIYDKNDVNTDNIKQFIYNKFKELINPDNYRNKLFKMGGSPPSKEIIELLNKLHTDNSTNEIREYLIKYFPFFMHNRIGSLLSKPEKDKLNIINSLDLKDGELVAYQERFNVYYWVLYMGIGETRNKRKVLMKENDSYNIKEVFSHTLIKYPKGEEVDQTTNNGIKLSRDKTIEKYNLDNLI